ncbi:MAG: DUF4089 domain-containing protein [Rhodocyclaceae bacterium]|nr:DUF4089 domain-containing protein [Rhodocyclaceae bacterium]
MTSPASEPMHWPAYVAVMAEVHGLALTPARQAEVALQLQRIAALAQVLLDYPLDAQDESAPVFVP